MKALALLTTWWCVFIMSPSVLGTRVNWDSVPKDVWEKEGTNIVLATADYGGTSQVSQIRLTTVLDKKAAEKGHRFYLVQATVAGTSRFIWQGESACPYEAISSYSFARAEHKNILGMAVRTYFSGPLLYEIPLLSTATGNGQPRRDPDPSGRMSLRDFTLGMRIPYLDFLPERFLHPSIDDLELAATNDSWRVRLWLSEGHEMEMTDGEGVRHRDSTLEDIAFEMILTRPVGQPGAEWRVVAMPTTEELNREECRANLRVIMRDKERWTDEQKDGDRLNVKEFESDCFRGRPRCPGGGRYVYGRVGEPPRCTIHGAPMKEFCNENMARITDAKLGWAQWRKKPGDPIVPREVEQLMKRGCPHCPEGGKYTYGPVDAPPKCSVHGTFDPSKL